MIRPCFAALALILLALARPVATSAAERYECLLEPWEIVKLGARSTGVLQDLRIDRGDAVDEGQEIASLNSEVENASVALAKAKAESTTQIELAEARAEFEKLSSERNEALFKRRVISSQQMDEAEATLRIAELRVNEAKLDRQLSELEYRRALALYDLKTIRTPIAGVVVSIDRTSGEYVAEGDHVATIAQIDPIRAEAYLPLDLLDRLSEGAKVRVFPQAPVGGELEGVIEVVDRIVEARSGTIGVRVRIQNPEKLTLAGLRCDLEF
jgi:RND family efflux transporter MFP subunit